jgi:ubiquitin carboxyl-terminal hydrolase L3
MVPQPVKAVLILFPITTATEELKDKEEAKLKESGQEISSNLWFTKQTVSNACGTVAMLHAFANADVQYKSGSFLEAFMKVCADLDPMQRAKMLENPSKGQPDVEAVHQEAGKDGQTAPPPDDEDVRFLSFRSILLR